MSLQSAYELSNDPSFRGKVTAALCQVARKFVDENNQSDEGQARVHVSRDILLNILHYSERAWTIVSADPTIDSSSSDEQIVTAVRKAVIAIVR